MDNETIKTDEIKVDNNPENSGNETKEQKVTFDPAQQAHIDKLIADATKRIYKNAEKKYQELNEAEKLKNMSEDERSAEQIKQYERKIKEYERKELVNQFENELTDKGLPRELAAVLPVENADEASRAIDILINYKEKHESDKQKLSEQLDAANRRTNPPKTTLPFSKDKTASSPLFGQILKQYKGG